MMEDSPVPELCIGMPVFNGERFIKEALDSLLAQTYRNFTLIISDNHSSDRTEEICRDYAGRDNRIRYIRQAQNIGGAENFRFLINNADSAYFMWAAADDVWSPDWIATLLPVAVENQCLAYGMLQSTDAEGNNLPHPANMRPFDFSGFRWWRRLGYYYFLGPHGKANPIYGIFPRKVVTEDMLSVFCSAGYASDCLFLYMLLDTISIRSVAGPVLYKRIHDSCEGGGASQAPPASKAEKHIRQNSEITLKQIPMLGNYRRLSRLVEKPFLFLLYPLILFRLNHLFRQARKQLRAKRAAAGKRESI